MASKSEAGQASEKKASSVPDDASEALPTTEKTSVGVQTFLTTNILTLELISLAPISSATSTSCSTRTRPGLIICFSQSAPSARARQGFHFR